jgi:hypothetical protein
MDGVSPVFIGVCKFGKWGLELERGRVVEAFLALGEKKPPEGCQDANTE